MVSCYSYRPLFHMSYMILWQAYLYAFEAMFQVFWVNHELYMYMHTLFLIIKVTQNCFWKKSQTIKIIFLLSIAHPLPYPPFPHSSPRINFLRPIWVFFETICNISTILHMYTGAHIHIPTCIFKKRDTF